MFNYSYWIDPKVAQREVCRGSVAVEDVGNGLTAKQTFRAECRAAEARANFVVAKKSAMTRPELGKSCPLHPSEPFFRWRDGRWTSTEERVRIKCGNCVGDGLRVD